MANIRQKKMDDIISKAAVLVEALPYVQEFRNSVFVIKYGGSFMDDPNPEIRASVAGDIAFLSAVGIHAVNSKIKNKICKQIFFYNGANNRKRWNFNI